MISSICFESEGKFIPATEESTKKMVLGSSVGRESVSGNWPSASRSRESGGGAWRRELELINGGGPKELRKQLQDLQNEDKIRQTVFSFK